MQFKEKVYVVCIELLNKKIKALQTTLRELADGAISDGKSSAGDKHETARAMMQLEQEKISKQLDELLNQKAVLEKIDCITKSSQIIKGSLIKTNNGYLFLSIALGKVTIDKIDVMVLSPQSPLGLKLISLKVSDNVQINSVNYIIEEVL